MRANKSLPITDDELRDLLRSGVSHAQIAGQYHLSQRALKKRITDLEKTVIDLQAAPLPTLVLPEAGSLWSMKEALEDVYSRLYQELERDGEARLPILRELRATIETAHKFLESLHAIKTQQEFEDEVLQVLHECDPALREKALRRLHERRSVRAALSPR